MPAAICSGWVEEPQAWLVPCVTEQLGAIIVRAQYAEEMRERHNASCTVEREGGIMLCVLLRERQIWGGKGSEEQDDVSGLPATWGHGDILAWAVAEGHVWVSAPTAARASVDVPDFCYHQRLCWCLESGLIPEAILFVRVIVPSGSYRSEWLALVPRAMVTCSLGCCWRAMSGSVVLP